MLAVVYDIQLVCVCVCVAQLTVRIALIWHQCTKHVQFVRPLLNVHKINSLVVRQHTCVHVYALFVHVSTAGRLLGKCLSSAVH